jgi:hypothetical protein
MYQKSIDGSPEAVVVADPVRLIRYWNRAGELFVFSAAEAMGRP